MVKRAPFHLILILFFFSWTAAGCSFGSPNLSNSDPNPTDALSAISADLIGTSVQETVAALAPGGAETEPPDPVATFVARTLTALNPTGTDKRISREIITAVYQTVEALKPAATEAVSPEWLTATAMNGTIAAYDRNLTSTAAPEKQGLHAAAPSPCDVMTFVADMSVPDGTVLEPGEAFRKTWRIRNSGACAWTTAYQFVFTKGDRIGAPESVSLPVPVNPGESVDISVDMTAPVNSGTYRGHWMLKNPSGRLIGLDRSWENGVWVDIRVGAGGSLPLSCKHFRTAFLAGGSGEIRFSIGVQNTGHTTWVKSAVQLVHLYGDLDNFIGRNRRYTLPTDVQPGQSVEFIGLNCSSGCASYFYDGQSSDTWAIVSGSDTICTFDGLGNRVELSP